MAEVINAPESTRDHASTTPNSPWLTILAASSIMFIGVGYTNTYGIFEQHYQTTILPDEAPEKLILVGSVSATLYFILGAFTGRLADTVGYRTSVLLGSALMIGAMFAASVAETFWQIFLTQGVMYGLGLAFVYMPVTSISRQCFGASRHGLANGIVVSGGALGGCVLPYCVQIMLQRQGLSATFRILGFLAAGVLGPACVLMSARQGRNRGSRPTRMLEMTLLEDPRFVGLLIASAIAMTGFLPRYFLIPSSAEARGIDPTYASWLLGIMNGLSIVGRIGIGCFADRFGKVTALTMSFLMCGLGHVAFWLPGVTLGAGDTTTATVLFTLFVAYVGVLGSGFISLFPVVIADLFGADNLASKTGMLNTAVGLTSLAGPSAIYAIVGSGGDKRWTAGVATAGAFMMTGAFVLMGSTISSSRMRSVLERGASELRNLRP